MKLINNLYFYPEQGMLDCNTYVIKGSPGIIIDPGSADFLISRVSGMKKDGIDPADIGIIVNTHLHIDHCGANESFKKLAGAKIALHPVQKQYYQLVVVDGTRLFGMEPSGFTEDYLLEDDRLDNGNVVLVLTRCGGCYVGRVCF